MIRAVLPHMRKAGAGYIVFVSSGLGRIQLPSMVPPSPDGRARARPFQERGAPVKATQKAREAGGRPGVTTYAAVTSAARKDRS